MRTTAYGQELVIHTESLCWRVCGLAENKDPLALRVKLHVVRKGETGGPFHIETVDLYNALPQRRVLNKIARKWRLESAALDHEFDQVFGELETLREEPARWALLPVEAASPTDSPWYEPAMELLRDPQLLLRTAENLKCLGVVGEESIKQLIVLCIVSRKLETPLPLILQADSGAGKSTLLNAGVALVPPRDVVRFHTRAAQDRALDELDFHRKLAVIEGDAWAPWIEEAAGHSQALLSTSRSLEINEQRTNSCLIVHLDEGQEQIRAVHHQQRESRTSEGLLARRNRERIIALHRTADDLLQPLRVRNPYVWRLRCLYRQGRNKSDFEKYLRLIDAYALLHQHQRPICESPEYGRCIEVLPADIERANQLLGDVYQRTASELLPRTQQLLLLLHEHVGKKAAREAIPRSKVRVRRRELRDEFDWSDAQLYTHLHRLVQLGYLIIHSGGPGKAYIYELIDEGHQTQRLTPPDPTDPARLVRPAPAARDAAPAVDPDGDPESPPD